MEHGAQRIELLLAKRSGADVRAGRRSGGGGDRDRVAQRREAEAGDRGGESVSDYRRDGGDHSEVAAGEKLKGCVARAGPNFEHVAAGPDLTAVARRISSPRP